MKLKDFNRPGSGFVVPLIILTLALTACGDSPTATPTTAAATTRAATGVVTTAAATSATTAASGATTAATPAAVSTTAATTARPATTAAGSATTSAAGAATTVASSATTSAAGAATSAAGTSTLPSNVTTGLMEIQVDPSILSSFTSSFRLGPDAKAKLYVSDIETDKEVDFLNTSLISSGYTFGLPGFTAPQKSGPGSFGVYSKAGSPDFLFLATPIPTDEAELTKNPPAGVSPAAMSQFASQVKGHKTLVIAVQAEKIVDSLKAAATGSGSFPTFPGGTVVTIPADQATGIANALGQLFVKDPHLTIYKTSDTTAAAARTHYADPIKAAGYNDITASTPAAGTFASGLQAIGGDVLGIFQKGSTIEVVLFGGNKAFVIPGLTLGDTDHLVVVITGSPK